MIYYRSMHKNLKDKERKRHISNEFNFFIFFRNSNTFFLQESNFSNLNDVVKFIDTQKEKLFFLFFSNYPIFSQKITTHVYLFYYQQKCPFTCPILG